MNTPTINTHRNDAIRIEVMNGHAGAIEAGTHDWRGILVDLLHAPPLNWVNTVKPIVEYTPIDRPCSVLIVEPATRTTTSPASNAVFRSHPLLSRRRDLRRPLPLPCLRPPGDDNSRCRLVRDCRDRRRTCLHDRHSDRPRPSRDRAGDHRSFERRPERKDRDRPRARLHAHRVCPQVLPPRRILMRCSPVPHPPFAGVTRPGRPSNRSTHPLLQVIPVHDPRAPIL
jgi:hypothetical protein